MCVDKLIGGKGTENVPKPRGAEKGGVDYGSEGRKACQARARGPRRNESQYRTRIFPTRPETPSLVDWHAQEDAGKSTITARAEKSGEEINGEASGINRGEWGPPPALHSDITTVHSLPCALAHTYGPNECQTLRAACMEVQVVIVFCAKERAAHTMSAKHDGVSEASRSLTQARRAECSVTVSTYCHYIS